MAYEQFNDIMFGGIVGGLIALGIAVMILIIAAIYIYHSLAWREIARRLKYKKSWLAWIPVANIAMIFQLGGFHWAWVFLILIPILGWIALLVLFIIATWRIYEKRKIPGWASLGIIIPQAGGILYLIAIGFAAWKNK